MTMFLVNRLRGRWKCRIRKGADCDRDHFRLPMRLPIDGRTANRTKVECHGLPAIRHPRIGLRASLRFNISPWEECRNAKCAPGSLLACETMAQGYVRWFSRACGAQLAAGTRRKSFHGDPSARRKAKIRPVLRAKSTAPERKRSVLIQ